MLRLIRGGDQVVVAPGGGGAIVGWTRNGRHMLRRPSPGAVLDGRPGEMGCFPMVPYCNRIGHRRFAWDGQTYDLAANFGDHPHAIHGVGWQRRWTVCSAAADRVSLSLRHDPGAGGQERSWPFAFLAHLTYALTEAGLTIEIAATNTGSEPAPMGIGAHPYFPRESAEGGGEAIAFAAEGVWLNDDHLPARHVPVPAAWDHGNGRAIGGENQPLDHCFTGWRGEARLPYLRISADSVFGALQVFTPTGEGFFCVEPVSHVPDALNRTGLPPGQAMRVLQPGETTRGAMRFEPNRGAGF